MSGNFSIQDAGFNIGVNVQLTKRDKNTGRILQQVQGHNRCLRNELLGIAKWLNGEFNDTQSYLLHYNWIPRYLGVGTNQASLDSSGSVTTEVTVNDTKLLSEISPRMKLPERNKIITRSTQDYVQLVIVSYLPSELYNNQTIAEAGLFSKASGNNCLFRIAFEGIPKTEDSVIEVNWTITIISVDGQNQPYEGVDKSGLRANIKQLLNKFSELYPDIEEACTHIDNPAIYDYGRSDATQAEVQKTSDLLAQDYRQIKDLEPGSKVIPEGYMNTKNGTATSNDLLLGKIAYSNGKELTGTVKEINKISIYKDSYSDISLVTEQQTSGSKTFLKIKSTPQLGNDGDHIMITSGQYKEELNIPIDVLAQFLGVRPEIIKYNEVILGVRGTYKGETV